MERSQAIFNARLQKLNEKRAKWEERINKISNEFDEEFQKTFAYSPVNTTQSKRCIILI